MNSMKSFLIIILSILLFIALTVGAISGLDKLLSKPSVVLTSTSCDPPCWNGIYPGQEDPWAVYEIVNSIEGVDQNSITFENDKQDRVTDIYWYFQRPAPDVQGVVYFKDDRVEAISILTVDSLKLGRLFDRLGEPKSYWTTLGRREYEEFLTVTLVNPDKGFAVDVLVDLKAAESQVTLKESTPVFRVVYFDPAAFDSLLAGRILFDSPAATRTGSFLPWPGFGPIPVPR